MASSEKNILMRGKNSTGDAILYYPITKADNVDGLDEMIVQPDWGQNDETQSDYVKNRTHYIGIDEITVNECSASLIATDMCAYYSFNTSVDFVTGETYRLYLNGELYAEGEFEGNQINNFSYSNSIFAISCYDFSIDASAYHILGDSCNAKITRVSEVVHPLDEKYIPDSIARINDLTELDSALAKKSAIQFITWGDDD